MMGARCERDLSAKFTLCNPSILPTALNDNQAVGFLVYINKVVVSVRDKSRQNKGHGNAKRARAESDCFQR